MPYGLTVQIERLVREERGISISAVIWVERDSQKGIAIGKNGSVLKKVGRMARLDIEKLLGQAIHLELFVKVKSNWADSEKDLMNLGYEAP
jgi:GTP-binding protein Era